MKQFFYYLFFLLISTNLLIGQSEINPYDPNDSEETRREQTLSMNAENLKFQNVEPRIFDASLQVTHPLFVGVDDPAIYSYIGNPATNEWLQAFIGADVWGAAYDIVNNYVYFNDGANLYGWTVGNPSIDTVGTVTDTLGANFTLVGLAFYDGKLYACRNITNEAIYQINLSTLVATIYIDYADADFDFGGLAFDPNTGELYGTNDDTSPFGSGLFKINLDGTGTLIAPYPAGESDIDGLAVSHNGIAYLVIDQPGNIYSYDLVSLAYGDTLASPWTTSEVFCGATWIYEMSGGLGVMLVSDNTVGTDSVEARLNALGQTYVRVTNTVALGMPTSDWLTYDAVFWIGLVSTGAEVDSCVAYLNAGGKLLVADNDQGYSTFTTSFFQDYLMSQYLSDAGSDGALTGVDMMDGVLINVLADPYPDDVLPNTGIYGSGVPIFKSPLDTTYAGMRGDGGTFRTQLLCWDPQYGDSYNANLQIVQRTINWLVDGVIPVELVSFKADVTGNQVTLKWETATELNNSGFNIQRKDANLEFADIGFVPGYGTTTEPRSYSFTDISASNGIYTYRLKQIDFDGTVAYSDEINVEVNAPVSFALNQNYPNPFNPTTKISFSLAVDSRVSVKIFDVLGQEVVTLVNRELNQGSHKVDFNATNLNSGVYFYRIEASGKNGENFVDVKKMMLIK